LSDGILIYCALYCELNSLSLKLHWPSLVEKMVETRFRWFGLGE